MAHLVIVRHGKSEWNEKGIWTGLTDIDLSEAGRQESRDVAKKLKDLKFDICYTSKLKRAINCANIIKNELGLPSLTTIESESLNERDYGDFTGKNKWEIKEKLGDEEFVRLRRSWDYPISNGETLRDVYNRLIPYYQSQILPHLLKGENVLIVAHGNSLRALVKFLENVSDSGIEKVEIETGQAFVYNLNEKGEIVGKEVR